jgi:hypothetical protein
MVLRFKGQALYRCRHCGLRLIAGEERADAAANRRPLSIADYLGLQGYARRIFTDHMILGGLISLLLLLVSLILFFAVAFSWIDLMSAPTMPDMPRDWE